MNASLVSGSAIGSSNSSTYSGEYESTEALTSEELDKLNQTYEYLQALAVDATLKMHASDLPPYEGDPSVALNGDVPFFNVEGALPFGNDYYSKLDLLGRCRTACAIVGKETMPVQHRGSIGDIRPSGWRISKYDWIDGKYLFNRCHLIGYQLTGQNANERNLMTGTRYLNVEGMQPFENDMADYVRRSGNHVLYRVTPLFEGAELVARGVVMEAYSIEDKGAGIKFCRWCPNVQPGVLIDYLTGKNKLDENHPMVLVGDEAEDGTASDNPMSSDAMPSEEQVGREATSAEEPTAEEVGATADFDPGVSYDYILNKSSHLVHRPSCEKVADMSVKNKLGFIGTRDEVLEYAEAEDYRLCKFCNP